MSLQGGLHLQVGKELLPSVMCSKNILPQKWPPGRNRRRGKSLSSKGESNPHKARTLRREAALQYLSQAFLEGSLGWKEELCGLSYNQTGEGSWGVLRSRGQRRWPGTYPPAFGWGEHMHLRPGLSSPDDSSHKNIASSPGQGLHGPLSIPYSSLWLQPLLSSQVLIPGLLWHHALWANYGWQPLPSESSGPCPTLKCTLLLTLTRLSVSEVGPLAVRKGHWCCGPL